MDILISGATAVTLNSQNEVIQDAYIGITGTKITYVGRSKPEEPASRVINGAGRVVLPGLVNAHTHLPMTLLRGWADDYDLQTWLTQYIFPAEDKLDTRCVYWGTLLGIAEAVASGTASVTDMYYFCDEIASAAAQSGIKANLARGITLFEPGFDFSTHRSAVETRELADRWHGYDNGRIRVDACVHAEYTSCPEVWRRIGDYAAERRLRLHFHLSETRKEHDACVEKYGLTPAAVFEREGLLRMPGTAAHCVWVTGEDMDILREHGISAAHSPVSNLKLGSGVAPVPRMLQKGLNVCLGTDGVASNNSHDLFEEIKLAAIVHKGVSLDPSLMPAASVLKMATAGGAASQGRENECGRIEVGLDADLIALDFDRPHLIPCHDAVSNLVYSARGGDVVMNMVKGNILYSDGQFFTIDMERVKYEVLHYALPKITG